MADIAKSGTPSISTPAPPPNCRLSGLLAGEDLAAGDACYVKSDGKIWRSTGAAANAAAKVRGFAAQAAKSGEAVTIFWDVVFGYGSGLTPGQEFFLSGATAGALADAASTGGTGSVAYAVDDKRVAVRRSWY